jgi:hypothetical protein
LTREIVRKNPSKVFPQTGRMRKEF